MSPMAEPVATRVTSGTSRSARSSGVVPSETTEALAWNPARARTVSRLSTYQEIGVLSPPRVWKSAALRASWKSPRRTWIPIGPAAIRSQRWSQWGRVMARSCV
jgi:hypothetical protein